VALKRNLLQYQGPGDWAVLNYDNAETRAMASEAAGGVAFFSGRGPVPGDSAFLRDGTIVWRRQGRETPVLPAADIPLRGDHNIENVAAATAVAALSGIEPEAIASAVRGFRPAPHRLELVERVDGVAYYNDSIATTPERALAGLRSFSEPVVLLLGGREKHLPLAELASEACRGCQAVIFFGEAAPLLEGALRAGGGTGGGCDVPTRRVETLAEAVQAAREEAQPGDVVLLSPACTSFDAYENFEERGDDFRRIVRRMKESQGGQPS
jgi:UDP-N-acetylmuramoylalanine--D-glutamate ligase